MSQHPSQFLMSCCVCQGTWSQLWPATPACQGHGRRVECHGELKCMTMLSAHMMAAVQAQQCDAVVSLFTWSKPHICTVACRLMHGLGCRSSSCWASHCGTCTLRGHGHFQTMCSPASPSKPSPCCSTCTIAGAMLMHVCRSLAVVLLALMTTSLMPPR